MTTPEAHGQELDAERDRLIERFVLMQSELGGLFYEMAIRDHLQLELLVERAAAMQRVEEELRELEHRLAPGHAPARPLPRSGVDGAS